MTQIILTSGSSFTIPDDWNSASNTIEALGAAGSSPPGGSTAAGPVGRAGASGPGGGAYAKLTNFSASPGASIPISIGLPGTVGGFDGGDTTFNTSSLVAKGGKKGAIVPGGTPGGAGGLASACTPTTGAQNGGTGGSGAAGTGTEGGGGGGGGGAGGPAGPGANGSNGVAGGIGGAGGAGDAGSGGTGGTAGADPGGAGGAGANGAEWGTAGSGGGGGGGGGGASGSGSGGTGGDGGTYGAAGAGGGGGGGTSGAGGVSGTSIGGVIVITYDPEESSSSDESSSVESSSTESSSEEPSSSSEPSSESSESSESEGCLTLDVLRQPEPCVPFEVGECPDPGPEPSSSSVDLCSSDLDGPFPSCITGWRDRPRKWYGNDAPGVTFGSIPQYFYVPADKEPVRTHSYQAFNWDSTGQLKSIEIDDFKTPRRFFWERDQPRTQRSISCPIEEPSSSDEDVVLHKTAGCLARMFAVQGTYGCVNPEGSSQASSVASSSSLFEGYSVPTIFPKEEFECYDIIDGIIQRISISDTDPTLTDILSEMALEFDSTGKLQRVFWGGESECDRNPCLWDRDKPPRGKPGCVVPFMQQSDRITDMAWDLWLIYFDSLGRYIWSCAYMRLCSCPITCSHAFCESTSIPQPFCDCRPLCLITGGCQGLASVPAECPATVSIDCEEALIPECVDDIITPGDCVYTYALECCPAPFPEGSETLVSSASDWSGIHNACQYSLEVVMTCETTDETQSNSGGG